LRVTTTLVPTGVRPIRRYLANGTKCYPEDGATVTERNAVRRLAERMVGSRSKFAVLPESERREIKDVARSMHQLGVNYTTAASAIPSEKRGFVYVITHPSWPGFVKIGRAFDPVSRLQGYQTGCPHRAYTLSYAVYFPDCYRAERLMHAMLDKWRRGGEWFFADVDEATQLIDNLRETTSCGAR